MLMEMILKMQQLTPESCHFLQEQNFPSYKRGTGAHDSVLGFPLTYRALVNTGDIVFDSQSLTDTFTYSNR